MVGFPILRRRQVSRTRSRLLPARVAAEGGLPERNGLDGAPAPMGAAGSLSRRLLPAASGVLLVLGACAAPSSSGSSFTPEAYAAEQEAYRTDPTYRAASIDRCVGDRAAEPQAARETVAHMLGVDPAKVDDIYCERLIAAVADGRVSYEDYAAIAGHHADPAAARRLIDALSVTSTEPTSLRMASASQLDAYAGLLRRTGRAGEADHIAADAAKLRQSERELQTAERAAREGRSYQTSTYLGFAPDRLLEQYATELRSLGRTTDAQQAEAVAAQYREDQAGSVNALMHRRAGGSS